MNYLGLVLLAVMVGAVALLAVIACRMRKCPCGCSDPGGGNE